MPTLFSIVLSVATGFQMGALAGVVFFIVTIAGNYIFYNVTLKKVEKGGEPGSPWGHQVITWVVAWIVASIIAGSAAIGHV